MSKGPGFHRCHAGGFKFFMPPHMEIALTGNTAVLRLDSGQIAMAVQINACPICMEPLTPEGKNLDRIKRLEGLK